MSYTILISSYTLLLFVAHIGPCHACFSPYYPKPLTNYSRPTFNQSHPPQLFLPFLYQNQSCFLCLHTHLGRHHFVTIYVNSLLSQHFSTCKQLTKTFGSKCPALNWLIVVYCSSVNFIKLFQHVFVLQQQLQRCCVTATPFQSVQPPPRWVYLFLQLAVQHLPPQEAQLYTLPAILPPVPVNPFLFFTITAWEIILDRRCSAMLDILIKFGHLRRKPVIMFACIYHVSIISIINVVEAHCYAFQCRRIDCEQIRSRIDQHLIAGRFSHEGLRQLRTKCFVCSWQRPLGQNILPLTWPLTFCTQLTKAFMAETSCN